MLSNSDIKIVFSVFRNLVLSFGMLVVCVFINLFVIHLNAGHCLYNSVNFSATIFFSPSEAYNSFCYSVSLRPDRLNSDRLRIFKTRIKFLWRMAYCYFLEHSTSWIIIETLRFYLFSLAVYELHFLCSQIPETTIAKLCLAS